tara:strand:- start:2420 stop:3196 length:777 start_codon:yes stop_codon:yes gene_type:complete
MAYTRKIKGVDYTLYKDEKEFRRHNPKQTIQSDWRGANTGDWIKTDDGQVTVVIKRGKIKTKDRKKSREDEYIRTLLGMANIKRTINIEGEPVQDIWRFGKKNWYAKIKDGNLSVSKRIFAKYIASGMKPIDAFMKAHENTKSLDYAKQKTKVLLKSKKVRQLIDKEIELLLNETGITKSYLLEKTKDIVDSEGSKDSDKMRAIETLMKLSGMLSTEKKVDSVSLIQEFTGFSQEKLEAFRAGVLPEPQHPKLNGKKA